MPKISSKNQVHIDTDNLRTDFYVDIMYTKDTKFYIEVPEDYKEVFDNYQDLPHSYRLGKMSYSADWIDNRKRLIIGNSETDVLKNFKETIIKFSEISLSKRDVIMIAVDCDGYKEDIYGRNGFEQKVGASLSLIYATEVALPGSKPKYYQYKEMSGIGNPWIQKTEIDTYKRSCIIDDTPENRTFLETLHSNLKTLSIKLNEFGKDGEKMIELISNNQKLIG